MVFRPNYGVSSAEKAAEDEAKLETVSLEEAINGEVPLAKVIGRQ